MLQLLSSLGCCPITEEKYVFSGPRTLTHAGVVFLLSGSAQTILRPFEGRKGAPYVWTTLKWSCLRSFGQTRQRWRTEFVFWATIVACMPKFHNYSILHQRPLPSFLKFCAMGKTAPYSIFNANSLGDTSCVVVGYEY